MNRPNTKIRFHLNVALGIALKEVERLARNHIKCRKTLYRFTMAMGTYFFENKNGNIKHNSKCKQLDKLISNFDEELHITGCPMTFTENGKIKQDW